MRRAWAGAVLCGAGMLGAGCNESGPPKRDLAQPVDTAKDDSPAAPGEPDKPDKTDPAAEAAIGRLLAAHTGGKLDRLAPIKQYKLVRKGRFEGPGPAVWTVEAVWPDRFRQQTELPKLGPGFNLTVRNGSSGWKLLPSQGMAEPTRLTGVEFTAFQIDIYGEWVSLLVPLLDRAARVAAPVPPVAVEGKPTTGVRVWAADFPPITLRIDDGTGHLARLEYQNAGPGGLVPITIAFPEWKTVDGLLLPARSVYSVNKQVVSTWDTAEYQFPKQIPDETFQKP